MAKGLTQALRLACYRRDKWKCQNPNCGNRNGLHPHHIEWKGKGGKDELGNLVTICWRCHSDIHDGRLRCILVDRIVKFEEVKPEKKP
jgi:5-methylcytosine-specific restriction endonuclease McrA